MGKGSKWFPNTAHGILLYLMKWVGSGVLMTGMLQLTQLHTKIMARWRELRNPKSQTVVIDAKYSPTSDDPGQSDVKLDEDATGAPAKPVGG